MREGNEEWKDLDRKKVRQQEYGNELRRNGDGRERQEKVIRKALVECIASGGTTINEK